MISNSGTTDATQTNSIPSPPERGIHLDDVFESAVGDGISYNDTRDVLQMSSGTSQTGAIWSKNKIDVRKPFVFKAYIYLGDQGNSAADGMTFSLQSRKNNFLGKSGQYLGMYATGERYYLSLEFDTYYNGDGLDNPHENSGLKKDGQHIAFNTGHSNYHYGKSELPSSYEMSNNYWKQITVTGKPMTSKYFKISYTYKDMGTGDTFSHGTDVYFTKDGGGDGGHTFLDDPNVYWGFTSSTGRQFEINALSFDTIPQSASIKTKDIQIDKGERWSPKDNFVSATNEYGETIGLDDPHLSTKDNVDTNKTGNYTVTYTYQGEYGTATASASVKVLEEFTLEASDITINQGEKFDPFDSRISLKAYDPIDGDLTNKIDVSENDVDSSTAGTYHVSYQVKNSSGKVAKKTITVTVIPFNPWPDGKTDGWKMFSGEDINLTVDPDNSILETNEVFFSDKQASIYKIFSGKDELKEGEDYRVTVYFKPLDDKIPLSSYRVKVSLKAESSSDDYRELINTTLNTGTPYQKGYYSVMAEFTVSKDELTPLINVENYQGGYIGSVSVLPIK
ncbi:lectin-like domain-containing protein [Pseudolactococcus plantarum]|uniref:lectin-like domain-containing protein n=1 Tax=Pseudolactococcus plantarum TaxID=1365 RepID=UPI0008354554|nr:bacterial Ig-like domain-containing protein [Lactococcus plantarum]HCN74266.1 DUF5011 domain-containing protein [Lactococcus sp.]